MPLGRCEHLIKLTQSSSSLFRSFFIDLVLKCDGTLLIHLPTQIISRLINRGKGVIVPISTVLSYSASHSLCLMLFLHKNILILPRETLPFSQRVLLVVQNWDLTPLRNVSGLDCFLSLLLRCLDLSSVRYLQLFCKLWLGSFSFNCDWNTICSGLRFGYNQCPTSTLVIGLVHTFLDLLNVFNLTFRIVYNLWKVGQVFEVPKHIGILSSFYFGQNWPLVTGGTFLYVKLHPFCLLPFLAFLWPTGWSIQLSSFLRLFPERYFIIGQFILGQLYIAGLNLNWSCLRINWILWSSTWVLFTCLLWYPWSMNTFEWLIKLIDSILYPFWYFLAERFHLVWGSLFFIIFTLTTWLLLIVEVFNLLWIILACIKLTRR